MNDVQNLVKVPLFIMKEEKIERFDMLPKTNISSMDNYKVILLSMSLKITTR